MKCTRCEKPMEVYLTQAVMGDLTCCGERERGKPCRQKGHKNYLCKNCFGGLLYGRVDYDNNT